MGRAFDEQSALSNRHLHAFSLVITAITRFVVGAKLPTAVKGSK